MTASDIVGRKAELEAVDRFLDRLARGPAAIAFEGHPGIGKTTLWQQMFAPAAARSFVVLSCRPVEAEAKLAFASLADLFEPIADEIVAQPGAAAAGAGGRAHARQPVVFTAMPSTGPPRSW
jgi:predicted ATPase